MTIINQLKTRKTATHGIIINFAFQVFNVYKLKIVDEQGKRKCLNILLSHNDFLAVKERSTVIVEALSPSVPKHIYRLIMDLRLFG